MLEPVVNIITLLILSVIFVIIGIRNINKYELFESGSGKWWLLTISGVTIFTLAATLTQILIFM